ncbi:MAG: glycosyltransferase family 4 protein [Candidatus Woesearchaeota archaeon]
MRICYVNPTFLVKRPLSELVERFGKENDVGVLLPVRPFSKGMKLHHTKKLQQAKVHTYWAVSLPGNFEWPIPISPMFFINVIRMFRRYDVIHMWTFFYLNTFFVMLVKLLSAKKRLIISCDTFPGLSFSAGKVMDRLFKLFYKMKGWFVFGVPDKVHLYGESLVPFAQRAGVKSRKIRVIPTGVDEKQFEKVEAADREALGVKKDEVMLFYGGLLVPRKGIDIMLETVKYVTGVKLVLAGEGPKRKQYERMAREIGVAGQVKFLGWRKDIPGLLKASDVVFLPSRGEGLPGIVMEGMQAGKPVVSTDTPCIPDLIEDEKEGYLCTMETVEEFVAAVEKLKDGKLREKMGRAAKKKIKKFDWEKLAREYEKLYE